MHVPVLPRECLELLALKPEGVYLDATCGLGGHTAMIAAGLSTGFVIANDRDAESLAKAAENTASVAERIRFRHGPFSGLESVVRELGLPQVDGLLADLGVSRYQLTDPGRGFSIQADGPLDMRMDRGSETTAAHLVNHLDEAQLADLIYEFGEERRSRQVARAIVRARPIQTTGQLARVVESVVRRVGRLHPATQTFMALRLAVNAEQDELDALLDAAPRLVRPGGRVAIISFMSLEDRKVKHSFQALAREARARVLTKHVVVPSAEEIRSNPAARSAKLRAVEIS